MSDHTPHANTYDAVPYPKIAHRRTHPRHLEAIATLFGMNPPATPTARVLELGCAAGGNLIPQACDMRKASFVGVDLSERQVAEGQEMIRQLGLTNIELRCANILDIDDRWGKFDYVICHGVYSWVPPNVQEKILEICRRNLSPNGVALVSYNTLPGWHPVLLVREILRYHTAPLAAAAERIEQAMAMLRFLVENMDPSLSVYPLIKDEYEMLQRLNTPSYLYHEHLEPFNEPLYLHQFVERARARGLQYLADAEIRSMLINHFPARIREVLEPLPLLQQEQYLDFLRNRRFRCTLLCHGGVELNRTITAGRMMKYHFALLRQVVAPEGIDLQGNGPSEFRMDGVSLTVRDPLVKAAMLHLSENPTRPIHFTELYGLCLRRLGLTPRLAEAQPETTKEALANGLMTAFLGGMVELFVYPPRFVVKPGQHPIASPLARLQAARDGEVTNQRHEHVRLDPLQRLIIHRLDGKHDRQSLVAELKHLAESGKLTIRRNDQPLENVDGNVLASLVDEAVHFASATGLLIG